jgi:polar amino acid transport system substrate-binding protein
MNRHRRMAGWSLSRRAWAIGGILALLGGCASAPGEPAADVRRTLAPTGTLRVAVYPGSPTSLVREAERSQMRGLTVDLGTELGRRLGVPVQILVLPRVAEVVAAVQRGDADMTITNATAERAKGVDFTAPLVSLELGLLVRSGSPLASVAAMDQPGARVGVSQGSTTQRVLGEQVRQATLVPMPTLQAAGQALQAGQLDGFATNKGILFELADRVPGARVLDGRWGLEHLAIATGKGRDAALPWLRGFAAAVAADGQVARAAERAGLRGTVPAGAR